MNCPNCEKPLRPDDAFCPGCSQRVENRLGSLRDFFKHFLNDYFAYDSTLSRSFKPLLFAPGRMTIDYLEGKRQRFVPPVRLYIFISVLFFLFLSFTGGSDSEGNDEAVSAFFDTWLPRLFFLLLPMFALFLLWFFRTPKFGFVGHFVFALHFHSFVFLWLSVYWLLAFGLSAVGLSVVNLWLLLALLVYVCIYLFLSLRRVYGRKGTGTLFRFVGLVFTYLFTIGLSSMIGLMILSGN